MLTGTPDEIEAVLFELAGGSEEAKQVIEKKEGELGREEFLATAKNIVLQTIDMLWVEHLESMEYLRGSVNLRAYGQRDPLTEYRKEGTRAYRDLEMALIGRVFELLEKLTKDAAAQATSLAAAPRPAISIPSGSSQGRGEVGRNDPCPCGSGKKWKKCGMLNTPEHQQLIAQKK
jgi:preprotein translocase subunit SecA